MQLRFLDYFVTLAREQHFARAAEACHVTQPTLSAGISTLETQLGRRLIIRDRRFVGLTTEGQAILPWAQRILSDHEALKHAIEVESGQLRGELQLGVIPASMPVIGHLAQAIMSAHPNLTLNIRSMTSRQIERGLLDYELDAGVTYLNNEPLAQVRSVTLYSEHYVFATHANGPFADEKQLSWEKAVTAPLCLLHATMQNRRILDTHLNTLDLCATPRVTADSYATLMSLIQGSRLASILPHSYASLIPASSDIRLIEIADPTPVNDIGLVTPDREPIAALSRVALVAAEQIRLEQLFGS